MEDEIKWKQRLTLLKTNEHRKFISELTIVLLSIDGGLRSEVKTKECQRYHNEYVGLVLLYSRFIN